MMAVLPMWVTLGALLSTTAATRQAAEALSQDAYLDIIDRYRGGHYAEATASLRDIPHPALSRRNDELPDILDLERLDDAKKLRGAVLLNAELALTAPSREDADFYLEGATHLADWLGFEEGTAYQRRVHLAVAYRLYDERRIVDALHVLRPAASHFADDPELASLLGRLEELSGWLNGSEGDLVRARVLYEERLRRGANAVVALRLARVLTLLGENEAAVPLVERALEGGLSRPNRVIARVVLGDALRRSGRTENALTAYRRATELDGRCQAARVALGQALQHLGRTDEARGVFDGYFRAGGGIAGADCFQRYLMSDASRHVALWRALREAVR